MIVLCSLLWSCLAVAQSPQGAQEAETQEVQQAQQEDDHFWGKTLSMGSIGGIHAGLYTFAYFAWYKGRNISDELVFRDEGYFALDTYAGGADKLGHMFSNYALTRGTIQILRGGGWSDTVSNTAGAGLTLGFFTAIEIKDGYHQNFGFSWGDMTFNLLGIGLALAMENYEWVDRHFDYRVEYVPTKLFIDQLLDEGVVDAAEDYSGQTFILAHHLRAHKAVRQSQYLGWMQYMDVVAGFGSRNYLPKPVDPRAMRHQDVFLGVALNVQEVIDQIFYKDRSQRRGAGYATQRFVTEILAVPFTTLPVITRERTEDLTP
jgi:hypothetical protein